MSPSRAPDLRCTCIFSRRKARELFEGGLVTRCAEERLNSPARVTSSCGRPGTSHKWWNAGTEVLHTAGWCSPPDNIGSSWTLFASAQANGRPPGTFRCGLSHDPLSDGIRAERPARIGRHVLDSSRDPTGRALGRYRKFKDAPAPVLPNRVVGHACRFPMTGAAYDVRLEELRARPLAVVRRRVSRSQLSVVVPAACGEVWNVIRAQQIRGAGRHVAVYLDDQINLEVGVELDAPFAGHGDVIGSATPAGAVATAVHFGPYNQLADAHGAILRWCERHGHPLAGPTWEIYGHWVDEWNRDPAKIRTDVFYLVQPAV